MEEPVVEETPVVEEIVKPAVEDLPEEKEEESTADIEETTQTVSEAYDLISEVKDKKESLERLDTVIAAYQATDPQATFSDENKDESVTYQVTKTDEENNRLQ